ncbi:nuclear transport factor 2 family protein [Ralstonia insidiosa]|nr:nuclear transport factor 2 family protein [Ralstonia insidiosa]
MAHHDSKALANKFIHALETRDLDAVSDLLADDVVFEDVPLADTVHRGKPKAVEKVAEFFGKSSSYVWKKHRVVSENGTVFVERTSDIVFGDKKVTLPMVVILEFNDAGKLTLFKDYFDLQTLQSQLA